jgi:hypothetical protein
MPRALELAADLAEEPQVATRLLKRAVHNAAHLFDEAGDHIGSKSATATSTTRERAPAFFERRPAVYNKW